MKDTSIKEKLDYGWLEKTSKAMQKDAQRYAKRTKAVLKELKKKLKPKSIKERLGYNMMMGMFIDEIADYIKNEDPQETKKAVETLIKRLMWIIE